ncbi:SMP-30/gluconolactonase/LRE family protein [Sphingosinicella microcystinivorans]|uniref:SMP-30/gluconolactonase/LRE family protein n=1 Tax=Sphingosinicella microcystinivorans TaxID=335406 RepID=UPI0022F40224|nr:SMP-30/gluconolactonase/LRE family protein [Sphingosinicella microcystinivorans]WBX85775.1 SMP-30/gluconolactonase/LRE family protein [Sphingosinicella microcystinivorans]
MIANFATLLLHLAGSTATPGTQPPLMVIQNVGFDGSEAARYDAERDEYLVSNLTARGPENNGFISRVSPDGKVISLKWITGGVNGVTLADPLGMYLHGDLLYVADISAVRLFDRKSGAPRGNIEIPDAVRLNDLVVAKDGTVYVTDSGNDTMPGALFSINAKGEVSTFAPRDPALERPNGITVDADGHIIHGGRGVNLVTRNRQGHIIGERTLPTGQFDGIVLLPNGDTVVASQLGKNVYRVPADSSPPVVVADNIEVPAAIGIDHKRMRLLVPQIRNSSVSIFNLGD